MKHWKRFLGVAIVSAAISSTHAVERGFSAGGQVWGAYNININPDVGFGLAHQRVFGTVSYGFGDGWSAHTTVGHYTGLPSTGGLVGVYRAHLTGEIGDGMVHVGLHSGRYTSKLYSVVNSEWIDGLVSDTGIYNGNGGGLTSTEYYQHSQLGVSYEASVADGMAEFAIEVTNGNGADTSSASGHQLPEVDESVGFGFNLSVMPADAFGVHGYFHYDLKNASVAKYDFGWGAAVTFSHEMFNFVGEVVGRKVNGKTSKLAFGGAIDAMFVEDMGLYASFRTGNDAAQSGNDLGLTVGPHGTLVDGVDVGLFYKWRDSGSTGSTATTVAVEHGVSLNVAANF